ncbi:MAG: hypothetical protein B7Z41_00775 [Rhizobiales bacterium 12-66-7]|nr:MAG: hypothetical protein B7Z41_00775 [Rhizobiales bacterium 12-66-7]
MWYVTEKIGETRYKTPEGFLVCQSVPLARTGLMTYGAGEVPIEAGPDGIILIERGEADVFDPKTIASFFGKPVTDEHPDEDVTPENWAKLAKGEIHNPRRGEGIWSDCLVGDLFIKDADTIAQVLGGKVEVSCGYDADYEQTAPGRGRQHNIIGNHVALVEHGRCGPRCSIGDSKMAKTRKSWKDNIRDLLKSRQTLDEEMAKALEEGEVMDDEPGEPGGTHVHVHLNGTSTEAPKAEAAPGKDEGEGADPVEERFTRLEASVAQIAEAVAKLSQPAAQTGDEAEGEKKDDEKEKTADEDVLEEGDVKEGKTVDSAALSDEFKDTIARAEILAPGIKIPTFDAAVGAKKVRDNLCALRRKALDAALSDDVSSDFVKPLVASAGVKSMTCDAVKMSFSAASEIAKRNNNDRGIGYDRATRDASGVKIPSISDINKGNRDFWAKRS